MLRCSTAWCISSHEVVYFGVRPFDILIRYHDADAIVCITTHRQSSFQLPMRRRSQLNDLNLLWCPLALLLLVGERRRQSQTEQGEPAIIIVDGVDEDEDVHPIQKRLNSASYSSSSNK